MKKTILVVILILLFLTSCRAPETSDTPSPDTNEDEISTLPADTTEDPVVDGPSDFYDDIQLSIKDVHQMFVDEYPNSNVNEITLERKHDHYQYTIEGYDDNKEYKLTIHAMTKEIEDREEDDDNDNKDSISLTDLDFVDELLKQALQESGEDFFIDEYTVEMDDNQLVIDIELRNSRNKDIEYKFNLINKELLEKDE